MSKRLAESTSAVCVRYPSCQDTLSQFSLFLTPDLAVAPLVRCLGSQIP